MNHDSLSRSSSDDHSNRQTHSRGVGAPRTPGVLLLQFAEELEPSIDTGLSGPIGATGSSLDRDLTPSTSKEAETTCLRGDRSQESDPTGDSSSRESSIRRPVGKRERRLESQKDQVDQKSPDWDRISARELDRLIRSQPELYTQSVAQTLIHRAIQSKRQDLLFAALTSVGLTSRQRDEFSQFARTVALKLQNLGFLTEIKKWIWFGIRARF